MYKRRKKVGRDPACLPLSKKKTAKSKCTKNFAWCGRKNFPRATKAYIFIIKKCGWKNLEKNENAVSESHLKIPAESMEDAEREDDGEYCGESWQRLKGRMIMLGEALEEKLNEAVCCRVCQPNVTFLENINCKVIKKLIVIQLLTFVTGRSLLDLEPSAWYLLRGFQRAFLSHLGTVQYLPGGGEGLGNQKGGIGENHN